MENRYIHRRKPDQLVKTGLYMKKPIIDKNPVYKWNRYISKNQFMNEKTDYRWKTGLKVRTGVYMINRIIGENQVFRWKPRFISEKPDYR